MADLPTFDDLFRVARDEALSRNGKITQDAIERRGTDVNIFTAMAAAVGDEVIAQLAIVASGLFLDSCKGALLQRLVFDRYGIVPKLPSPALVTLSLSTSVANPTAFSIPANSRFSTADNRVFITLASATFPAGSVGPINIAARSLLAGAAQQVRAGTVTSIIGQLTNSPSDLVCTNVYASAGASDGESDDSLRERARQFFTTARRGTLEAIRVRALSVAGVTSASVFEAIDVNGRPATYVELIVTDAYTDSLVGVTPTPSSYQTQSNVLAQTVFNELSDTRPAGIYVRVSVAQVILQPIVLALQFRAGVDTEETTIQARARIVDVINRLRPGETLRRSQLDDALLRVPGLVSDPGSSQVLSPAGDVVTLALQVLRTNLSLVAVG